MLKKTFVRISNKINSSGLPATLLKNFIRLSKSEIISVRQHTTIERQWYDQIKPFETIDEIMRSYNEGKLAKITEDQNYLPILRLRNQLLVDKFPPFLTINTKKLLDEICKNWRKHCDKVQIDPKIKLALTSLVRTIAQQDTLIKAGKLAMPNSPHLRGEAFDIDASGYYLDRVPINPRNKEQKEFSKAFSKLHAKIGSPKFGDYKKYNSKVHEILITVLAKMRNESKLNFVYEYPGTTNACLHICRNPNYSP
ncbi:MAG: DUF5715 family protein [bacterium]|nr:DUF5715 family protein [bacterium]